MRSAAGKRRQGLPGTVLPRGGARARHRGCSAQFSGRRPDDDQACDARAGSLGGHRGQARSARPSPRADHQCQGAELDGVLRGNRAQAVTDFERPAFVSLRRLGFEGEASLGEEPVDERGPVLDALEPVPGDGGELVDAAGGEVAQAVLHVRPDPFGGVEIGGVGGQPDHGQPVAVRLGERVHHGADVGVQVVPDQDDRGMQLLVRGGDQAGVVGFGHAAALAFTPAVQAHPVEQAAARARPQAHQARHRHPPRSLAGHPDHGRVPATGPGPGLRRAQALASLVLEADIRPGRRR